MSRTFHHSKKAAAPYKGRTCKFCGLPIKGYHQKIYCEDACKQRAYRQRTAELVALARRLTAGHGAANKTTAKRGAATTNTGEFSTSERDGAK